MMASRTRWKSAEQQLPHMMYNRRHRITPMGSTMATRTGKSEGQKTDTIDLRSKFLGAMIGTGLGDALGERAVTRRMNRLLPRGGPLTYTDGTAMTIGVAESLAYMRRVDEKHLGDRLALTFKQEPDRGYSPGPPSIFRRVEQEGISYREAAQSLFDGRGSLGNAGAVRVAPVALFFFDSNDLYEQAAASAMVTHAHPVSADGAAVMAFAIAEAVKLHPNDPVPTEELCDSLVRWARTTEFKTRIGQVRELVQKKVSPETAAAALGRSRRASDSVPFAIYSFLSSSGSFRDCLLCAVGHGGDRDTLGAMACSISGAYLGVESIPQDWRERLENREYIAKLATLLWQLKTGTTS